MKFILFYIIYKKKIILLIKIKLIIKKNFLNLKLNKLK